MSNSTTLDLSDICAGSFLLIFGIFGVVFNSLVCWCMAKLCREITGFRFLLSHAISDMLLLIQFAIWPGIVILTQNEFVPKAYRWHLHHYLDFTWWAMVWHYLLVALSRFGAMQWPNWFRCLSCRACILACMCAWIMGLVQSAVEHQFKAFVTFYYDPQLYGLTADWGKYNQGTAAYYLIMNLAPVMAPIPVYALALLVYFRRRSRQLVLANDATTSGAVQRQLRVEKRLLFPCVVNAGVFIVEQCVIHMCSRNSARWITFMLIVVFALSALINPATYLICSSAIRKQMRKIGKKGNGSSTIYQEYDLRYSTSSMPSRQQRDSTAIL